MKRVVVDHFGGPEVLRVVEEDDPRPGPGEVRVKVLAAGVSYTDAMLRAGSYLGVPNPPFTPGYELVGVVEELGPGCTRLRVGDRVGALTVWGADAERVCVPEAGAVEVPEDLDPGEVLSLVFIYMTAYQLLHRTAQVKPGEAVLVHGAAGRVGTAVLELGRVAGLRLYGTCSARDRAAVERLGAVAIDYRKEDFVARVRALPGKGVDVVLDGLGGTMSLHSFRALRPAEGSWCTGTPPRSRTDAGAGEAGRCGTRPPRWSGCGVCSIRAGAFPPTGSRGSAATVTRCSRWAGDRGRFRSAASRATRSGSGRTSAPCSNCCAAATFTRSWRSACR
jgi:NADPH:quinone reductase-like Zn-dependent oxidoreductase